MFYRSLNFGLDFVFLGFVFVFVWLIWSNVQSVPFAIVLTITFGLLSISAWFLSFLFFSYLFQENEQDVNEQV